MSRTVGGVLYQTSFAHDELGRVSSSTQAAGAQNYTFFYQYSLSDRLAQLKYPSGRVVEYTPDAKGRVLAVKDVGSGTNYAMLGYTDAGQVGYVAMRNGINESYSYNDRLQRTSIQAGSLLTLGLYPRGSGLTQCASGNDGNVRSESITIPGASWTQTFGYDGVNRLTSAIEMGQGTGLRLMTM